VPTVKPRLMIGRARSHLPGITVQTRMDPRLFASRPTRRCVFPGRIRDGGLAAPINGSVADFLAADDGRVKAIDRSDDQHVVAAVAILSLHEFDDGPEDDGRGRAFRVVTNPLHLPLTVCADRS
jgi:hypothetical protein